MTSWRIIVLCVRCPAARGAGRCAGSDQKADRRERAPRDLAASGAIQDFERADRLATYKAVERTVKRLPRRSTRRNELAGVVATVEGIASAPVADRPAARAAVADARAQPRVLVGQRRPGRAPRRISRPGSRSLWQYFPGQGLVVPPARQLRQAQPAPGPAATTTMGQLLEELLALRRPARRRRGLGVLLHVLRRPAAVGLGPRPGHGHPVDRPRRPAHRPRGRGAADRRPGARRLRDAAARGRTRGDRERPRTTRSTPSIPGLRVINGFVQALVGLYDLGRIGNDDRARTLYADGERAARRRAAKLRHRRVVAVLARLVSSTSPTSPTTSCCARSCAACAIAPTIPSTATPSCASPSTSSSRRSSSLVTTRLRGGTRGQAAPAAVEDLARRAARGSAAGGSSRSAPRSWSATGRRSLRWPVPRRAGEYDIRADEPSTWRGTSAPRRVPWRS